MTSLAKMFGWSFRYRYLPNLTLQYIGHHPMVGDVVLGEKEH